MGSGSIGMNRPAFVLRKEIGPTPPWRRVGPATTGGLASGPPRRRTALLSIGVMAEWPELLESRFGRQVVGQAFLPAGLGWGCWQAGMPVPPPLLSTPRPSRHRSQGPGSAPRSRQIRLDRSRARWIGVEKGKKLKESS